MGGYSIMNHRALPAYYQMIDRGMKPIMGMSHSGGNRALLATVGSGFDRGWLELSALNRSGGDGMSEHCMALFEAWQDNGLATIHHGILDLTLPGQFWNVTMHQALINFLEQHPFDLDNAEKAA